MPADARFSACLGIFIVELVGHFPSGVGVGFEGHGRPPVPCRRPTPALRGRSLSPAGGNRIEGSNLKICRSIVKLQLPQQLARVTVAGFFAAI